MPNEEKSLNYRWTEKSGKKWSLWERSLRKIEIRLSFIFLNDTEVTPAFTHTHAAWITIKLPYVTHCWQCDTFYKTSFGFANAIINLFTLFFPPLWISHMFTNAFMREHSAGASVWPQNFWLFDICSFFPGHFLPGVFPPPIQSLKKYLCMTSILQNMDFFVYLRE